MPRPACLVQNQGVLHRRPATCGGGARCAGIACSQPWVAPRGSTRATHASHPCAWLHSYRFMLRDGPPADHGRLVPKSIIGKYPAFFTILTAGVRWTYLLFARILPFCCCRFGGWNALPTRGAAASRTALLCGSRYPFADRARSASGPAVRFNLPARELASFTERCSPTLIGGYCRPLGSTHVGMVEITASIFPS